MEVTFNTPALLFPAISLLLLAYTNRFLALASLVRKLHDDYAQEKENKGLLIYQIRNLRLRLRLVRLMQGLGVLSFVCCVACMYFIYREWTEPTAYLFAFSLLSLLGSLIVSLIEIGHSTKALEIVLSDIEDSANKFAVITDILPGRDLLKKVVSKKQSKEDGYEEKNNS